MLESLLASYGYPILIIGSYGIRTVTPFGIGMSDIKQYEAVVMDAVIGLSCLIWIIPIYRRRQSSRSDS